MTTRLSIAIPLVLCMLAAAEEWTRFRGPNGSGVAADRGYPSELNRDKNLVWRSPVRPGKSSPVLTRKHVFLTAFEDGKLYTQCFDRANGKLLWERSVEKTRDQVANRLNHAAAVTPVTDGENVYALFKDFGVVAYDAAGKRLWEAPLAPFSNTMGHAASPILAGELLILLADQVEGAFIAAFDKRNGEMRWRVERSESEAWGTPLLHRPAGGAPEIITTSRGQFGVHSAVDGKRTVTLQGLPTTVVGSPLIVGDVLFVQGYGSESPAPFSQRLDRFDRNKDGKLSPDEYGDEPFLTGIAKFKGDRDMTITEAEWNEKQREVMGPNCLVALRLERTPAGRLATPRELWRYDKSFTGVIPSPLVYDGIVYFVKNGGILTSLDAANGSMLKTGRLPAVGGYSSSPVAADAKVYFASEDGTVTVLRAGRDWDAISTTDFEEGCYATPALSGGDVFLRTDKALYRFAGSRAPAR